MSDGKITSPVTTGIEAQHQEMVLALKKPGDLIKHEITATDLDLWHMATGVCSEAGELLDAVKRVAVYRKPIDRENVVEELGDLEFFMQGLRENLGITREETLQHNLDKLAKRYHESRYSNQQAQERKDKQETA